VPTTCPKEFCRDVIAVAWHGDQSIAQVARSFGISESCLNRWLKIADREDGITAASAPRWALLRSGLARTTSIAVAATVRGVRSSFEALATNWRWASKACSSRSIMASKVAPKSLMSSGGPWRASRSRVDLPIRVVPLR
jgi:transposase-like protein